MECSVRSDPAGSSYTGLCHKQVDISAETSMRCYRPIRKEMGWRRRVGSERATPVGISASHVGLFCPVP